MKEKLESVHSVISNSFKELFFEEERHIYKVDEKVLPSVSSMLKNHYPEFDDVYWAKIKGKENFQQVLQEWKTKTQKALSNGTTVHLFAEEWWNNKKIKAESPQQEAVLKFLNNLTETGRYTLLNTELQMYSKKYDFAGTCDLLMWDHLNDYAVIMDYKTNENLDKEFGFLLSPFEYTPNSSFNKYQIQLSYYQLILEEINIEVKERYVIWLKQDGNYETRPCYDYTNVLKEYLNNKQ